MGLRREFPGEIQREDSRYYGNFSLIPGIWLGMACLQQADQGPHLPGFERSRYCRGRRQWPVYWASDCRYLGACFLPQMEECERRLSQRYLADRELG